MDIRCHEPASCANRVAPMEYRYLSCFQAQRFMKNFGLAITERALQRLDLYATLLVSDLLMDIPITASPTLPQLKSAIESLMDSNITYWSIMRSVSIMQGLDLNEVSEPCSTSKQKSSVRFGLFGLWQKLSNKNKCIKSKRKVNALEVSQLPSSNEGPFRKSSLYSVLSPPTLPSRLCMVDPLQIKYYCEMSSGYRSPELLAHIEVTNGALTHEVAKFLGEFFSQLLQAMLKELAKVALISNLTSITLALVEEAFHPRNAYMLLKFPMLSKLKRRVDLESSQRGIGWAHALQKFNHPPSEGSFVPAYISKNAAETVLVQHAATPGLTQQGLILVNKFLDEVILSLSRKLIMKRLTLSQLMVALNLSLKSCPLVEESIECVNRKFPSLIAVPVRPLVSSSCDDCPLPDAALIRHHYRLLAHYYSPHSELYQSRAISDFFRTQPFVLNTEAARYLAAVTAQLGLSVIQACADSLLVQQSNLEIATNVMGTHLLVPKLAELLPNCAITHRLNLYNFPHVDPTPDQLAAIYPASPVATPSLRTSNETTSTCTSSSSINTVQAAPPKPAGQKRVSRPISLAQLKIPFYRLIRGASPLKASLSYSTLLYSHPNVESGCTSPLSPSCTIAKSRIIDTCKFDSILSDNSTLKLSLTPSLLAPISDGSQNH